MPRWAFVVKKLNHGEYREHKALKIEWGKEQNGNLLPLRLIVTRQSDALPKMTATPKIRKCTH